MLAALSIQGFRSQHPVLAFAEYSRLPDEIQDSPLIDRETSGSATLFIGFVRGL